MNEKLDQLAIDFKVLSQQLVLEISEVQRLLIDRADDSSGDDASNLAEVIEVFERYRFKDPAKMS